MALPLRLFAKEGRLKMRSFVKYSEVNLAGKGLLGWKEVLEHKSNIIPLQKSKREIGKQKFFLNRVLILNSWK